MLQCQVRRRFKTVNIISSFPTKNLLISIIIIGIVIVIIIIISIPYQYQYEIDCDDFE